MRTARNLPRHRAGAMLILVGFLFAGLLALMAVAIDIGLFVMARTELQVTATAAAAGAAIDPAQATATALQLAEANLPPANHGAVVTSADIEVGNWDESTKTFTPNVAPLNAVRVTATKSQERQNAVRWLVGRVFDNASVDLSAQATAVQLPELAGAVAANGSIAISGSAYVDSYDSTEGPYDAATAGDNGDIVAGGSVSMVGSATIRGDLRGTAPVVAGSATVSGDVAPARRSYEYPSVDTSAVELNNDNALLPPIEKGGTPTPALDENRNLVLNGGVDYVMPSGTYYLNDLIISGQSSLTVNGPVTIYLTGNFDTSGGKVVNSTEDPNSLRIFMTGGSAKLTASVDWYGLLYAPDSEVTVAGDGDVYGAIIGGDVDLGGTGDIHFDQGLTVGDAIELPARSAVVQ